MMTDRQHGPSDGPIDLLERYRRTAKELSECGELKGEAKEFVDDLLDHAARVAEDAAKDSLTKLANRQGLNHGVEREWSSMARDPAHPGGVVFVLDLDGMKNLNDGAGHDEGDQFLIAVSDTLKKILRPTDIIARTGGDEFVVVCTATSGDNAKTITKRLRKEIGARRILRANGEEFSLSASIGRATYKSAADKFEDILKCADRRMFRIKRMRKRQERQEALDKIPDSLRRMPQSIIDAGRALANGNKDGAVAAVVKPASQLAKHMRKLLGAPNR